MEGKREASEYFVNGLSRAHDKTPSGVVPSALAQAKSAAEREEETVLREHPDLRGLYADRKSPALLQARLRLGIRVDRTALTGEGRAWVELAGRNPDGSIYRFSEFYVKIGDRWLQRLSPLAADIAELPKDFGPSLCTPASYRAKKLEKLLQNPEHVLTSRAPLPIVPAAVQKAQPGTCTAALCAGKTGGST